MADKAKDIDKLLHPEGEVLENFIGKVDCTVTDNPNSSATQITGEELVTLT